tara:strand:+ start:114 stop:497 length:384 start_codon:yes stop_codon:yes gene_type:complete
MLIRMLFVLVKVPVQTVLALVLGHGLQGFLAAWLIGHQLNPEMHFVPKLLLYGLIGYLITWPVVVAVRIVVWTAGLIPVAIFESAADFRYFLVNRDFLKNPWWITHIKTYYQKHVGYIRLDEDLKDL